MKAKHTPAPWKFYHESSLERGDSYGVSAKAPHYWVIPPMFISPEDARLIASAPELLEALKEMVDLWENVGGDFRNPTVHKALKTIAKAEGA
jgi:hypothetical protein